MSTILRIFGMYFFSFNLPFSSCLTFSRTERLLKQYVSILEETKPDYKTSSGAYHRTFLPGTAYCGPYGFTLL
jgi:hypothetical protein